MDFQASSLGRHSLRIDNPANRVPAPRGMIANPPFERSPMEEKTTDLCDRYPHAPTLPAGFRDFGASTRFSGPAMTVQCFEDNSRIKELSLTPGEGRVLVVDGGASQRCALLGDVIAADLVKNGWRGAIIYGCVRDAAVLASLSLGIKALGTHPRRSQKHGAGVIGAPIDIGNARVQAGDVIVADEDGVVVLKQSDF